GEIRELWMDMGSPSKEQSKEVYDLVQKLQPSCMVNGRIWNDCQDFLTMGDNELPSVPLDCPWETPASIYKETWGYRSWQVRGNKEEKVRELSNTARKVVQEGGNYLLNIGLMGDGSIQPFEEAVLKGIGEELKRFPLQRSQTPFQVPSRKFQGPSFNCGEPVVINRYTGVDYYSYHHIPTSLHWKVDLPENTVLSIVWNTQEPLEKEEKLVLEVDGNQFFSSLQKGRRLDSFITFLPLTQGVHYFIVHTIGSPLKRPALGANTKQLILKEERTQ
ncbi:MAG: alpha-L-fucosidase, partial [Sphaerochaetaceae bacterium]